MTPRLDLRRIARGDDPAALLARRLIVLDEDGEEAGALLDEARAAIAGPRKPGTLEAGSANIAAQPIRWLTNPCGTCCFVPAGWHLVRCSSRTSGSIRHEAEPAQDRPAPGHRFPLLDRTGRRRDPCDPRAERDRQIEHLPRHRMSLYWSDRGPRTRTLVAGEFDLDGTTWQASRDGPHLRWKSADEAGTSLGATGVPHPSLFLSAPERSDRSLP